MYQRKANPVDLSPARPLVCAPSRVCRACSEGFCAQMNETGQARAKPHKRPRLRMQRRPAAERNSKTIKARLVLTCNNFFKILHAFVYQKTIKNAFKGSAVRIRRACLNMRCSTGSMVNGWGSASEDERNFSSHRSSLGSSSDGSIFTHCSFAQALVAAADKAGYRLEGTSLSKRGKGLSHRPRPSSPFSTDGSTVGTHSLGHQRATRPTRKPRSQGAAPHRRDPGADDLPPPPEPPPSQGQNRVPGARNMVPPTERKAASLERTPMLGGTDDIKSSIDRQTRTSLDQHRQPQDRLGSMDRADDGRRGQKTEDGCLPYNKPSFPSPGGHSSSGTASSKSSTGPRKTDGPRQPQQWTVTEHADFLGSTGPGQYSGEL